MVLGVGVLAKLLKHDTKCASGRGTATLLEGGHSRRRAAVRQHSYRHRGQEVARTRTLRLLHH